jgi:SAM-dependent methyltransferase
VHRQTVADRVRAGAQGGVMRSEAIEQFASLARDHWWFRARAAVYGDVLAAHHGLASPLAAGLDLGGGAGSMRTALDRVCSKVVALDRDVRLLGVAGGGVAADFARLPFGDARFDLVAAFDVLEHARDERAMLDEVERVLRPGGLFVASVPAHAWLHANNDRVAGHERRYSRSRLLAAVSSSRLRVEHLAWTNCLLFPPIAAAVMALKACERIRLLGPDPGHTNLSLRLPRACEQLLEACFRAESAVHARARTPFGHSLLLLARREQGPSASAATTTGASARADRGPAKARRAPSPMDSTRAA